jgi:TM2 domain-containing membrane protein YozV
MSEQESTVPSEPVDSGASDVGTPSEVATPPPPPPSPYGQSTPAYPQAQAAADSSKKILAGVLGIVIGSLGIHKFVLGYQKAGLIMLLVTVLTCGIGGIVMGVIGIIEGIIYLTKSDQEFYDTYVVNKKEWF